MAAISTKRPRRSQHSPAGLALKVTVILSLSFFSTGCEKLEMAKDIVLEMAGKTKSKLEQNRENALNSSNKKKKAEAKKPDDQKQAQKAKKKKKTTVEFYYNPVGKRDPFRSYLTVLQESSSNSSNERTQRQLEDTETYELDQYRLTAIVSGTLNPMAMVEDPTGEGHVLKIGSRIGKNGGRITRITSDAIVIIEEFRAPTGERVRVPITVQLPQSSQNDSGLVSLTK